MNDVHLMAGGTKLGDMPLSRRLQDPAAYRRLQRARRQALEALILAEPAEEFTGDREVLRQELMDLCAEGIEERSQPAGAVIIDEIPVTANGKVDVKKLEEEFGHYDYLNQ